MVMNTRAKTQTTQQGRTKEKHFPTNIEARGPTALQTMACWKNSLWGQPKGFLARANQQLLWLHSPS